MKTLQLSIFALLIGFSVWAQNPLVEKGNAHYNKQEYKEAISSYEEVLNGGLVSADLYYNLGNAYYKTGQMTKAILNFERAKLLAPTDQDIQFNLEMANQHVVDAIHPLPQFFLVRWWNSLIRGKSADAWAVWSIVCFFVFLAGLALFIVSSDSRIRRISFWCGCAFLVFTIFTFSFASSQKKLLTDHRFAIVSHPSVTVKSSPSETGTNLFMVHEGLKVEIVDQLQNWLQVRLPDGNQGWLTSETIEKI